jgi:averantin hydroxylase
LTGNYHKIISDLHEEYGQIVRIGPNEVSYTCAEAWKDIYSHRQGHQEFPKDPYGQVAPVNGIPSMVGATRENHSRYRRLLAHAFSEKGLREQEPLIRKYVDLLIERLHQYSREGAQNMVSWYAWTTFDLIGDLTFGESFHCLENVYNHPWIAFVHGNIKAIPFISLFRRYELLGLMQFFVPQKLLKARQENYEYAKDKVTTRMKLGKDRGDFMDKVLKYEYPKGMTTEELVSNGSTLVLAGSETTATLLAGATYILLKHPRVMAKLVAEIRGTFANDQDITIVSVGQLKYLPAVLEESMRFYPPVLSGLSRVAPEPGDTVLGKWIPGGVSLPFPILPPDRVAKKPIDCGGHAALGCLPLALELPPPRLIHPRTFPRKL